MKTYHSALEKLGKKIRKARKQKGLTQEMLAEACDLHPTYVSDIERGKRNFSVLTLVRIVKVLKISDSFFNSVF